MDIDHPHPAIERFATDIFASDFCTLGGVMVADDTFLRAGLLRNELVESACEIGPNGADSWSLVFEEVAAVSPGCFSKSQGGSTRRVITGG